MAARLSARSPSSRLCSDVRLSVAFIRAAQPRPLPPGSSPLSVLAGCSGDKGDGPDPDEKPSAETVAQALAAGLSSGDLVPAFAWSDPTGGEGGVTVEGDTLSGVKEPVLNGDRADLFVVMDDLQYEAQNFQNRNRMKLNHGPQWLTVPLERGPQDERILDKRIVNRGSPKEHWQRKTWHTLQIHYGSTPFWKLYQPELEDLFTRPWDRLVELQMHILRLHLRWFEIYTPVLRASTQRLLGRGLSDDAPAAFRLVLLSQPTAVADLIRTAVSDMST